MRRTECVMAVNIYTKKVLYFDDVTECKTYFKTTSNDINKKIQNGNANKYGWVFDLIDIPEGK